ncbi:HEPN domain-containing protein [Stakelama tenebrarum]|uniref:Uncharacterized protein n=1 Tax=Stakelama tenebrarum TaxID=2711215 RepID=A0A6G6Y1G8_9SPHN|nr:HEPN domain-containing protein [Sphingosinithalassobacter tenebrarum]QIG78681.1 hypothetical protein G5C33_02015 [Sphingosinithalassobacter tenebrarum]
MNLKTPELRQALATFAKAARECAGRDVKGVNFEKFRLHRGKVFDLSDEVIRAQNDFVRIAIRKLGPIKGHAKVLDEALWDFVTSSENVADLDKTECLNRALEKIELQSASVCEFFRPCPLVELPDGTDRIDIGRVAINRSEARIHEFRKINPRYKFGVSQDWSLSIVVAAEDVGIVTNLPPTMWSVNLAAADPIREEEALWLVDVALSILRMTAKHKDLGVSAPTVGKVESHPFVPYDIRNHSFTLNQEGGGTLGGMTAPNDYRLSAGAVEALKHASAVAKTSAVFDAEPKSVAERFYQGCGWLTRGRRSSDRSDRLLYFFTAIEALLTRSDNRAPVLDTIARHAAVLLTDDNEDRVKIATDLKKLYAVRSALVHAGSRGAFDIDSNSAQQIAELLYFRVWNDIALSVRHEVFADALGQASYGLPFKPMLAS